MDHLAQLLNLPPEIYERSICKHLEWDSGPTDLAQIERCSMVACTARSGSSLLRDCLGQYGVEHREWLNTKGTIKRAVDAGEASTLTEYGDYLARSAKNGRFDMKGTYPAFLFLYDVRELPDRRDAWRFIFLKRANVVRQAISRLVADRTGQWTSRMPVKREISDADYSFDKIAKSVARIIQSNANMEQAFAVLGIEPMRIHYEDFVQDISWNTWALAKHIGLEVPAEPIDIKPTMKRQATDLNARWEARFREELDTTLGEMRTRPRTITLARGGSTATDDLTGARSSVTVVVPAEHGSVAPLRAAAESSDARLDLSIRTFTADDAESVMSGLMAEGPGHVDLWGAEAVRAYFERDTVTARAASVAGAGAGAGAGRGRGCGFAGANRLVCAGRRSR